MSTKKRKRIKKSVRKEVKMNRCKYCYSTENLTIDHKIPISQGGTDDIKNLQCLCKRCNGMKSSMSHRQIMRLFKWCRTVTIEKAHRKEKNRLKMLKAQEQKKQIISPQIE